MFRILAIAIGALAIAALRVALPVAEGR